MSVARVIALAIAVIEGRPPAGEDEASDEVLLGLVALELTVLDHDALQRGATVGDHEVGARTKEGLVVTPVDRLDHLDRNQMCVLTFEVAIVAIEDRDAITEAGIGDRAKRVGVLLLRDGGRRHTASVALCGVDREPSPSRPDLYHVVLGPQFEFSTEAIELLARRVVQRRGIRGKHGARVRHRRIEEEAEELIAQVVVGGDVRTVVRLGWVVPDFETGA